MVTAVKPRKSKPLPLVGLFRKPKNDNVAHVPALRSGIQNLPPSLHTAYEPYTPNTATLLDSLVRSKSRSRRDHSQLPSPVKPDIDTDYTARSSSRSRSLSRDTRTTNTVRTRSSSRSRSYSVGEQSPISHNTAPPVPSIPMEHQMLKAKSSPSPRSPKNMDVRGRHVMYDEDLDNRPIGQLMGSNIRSKSLRVVRSYEPHKESSPTSKSNPTTPIDTMSSQRERYMRDRRPSTSSSSDEDDNIPLAATNMVPTWFQSSPKALQAKLAKINKQSLLDDEEEEDDEDHIPIAALGPMSPIRGEFMTAADKYKEKVRERIFGEKAASSSSDEQDDTMLIQQAYRMRQVRRQSVDDEPRGRRSKDFLEPYPEEERRGRSRSRSRITASEKPCRNRVENDVPPVPRLPSVYNV